MFALKLTEKLLTKGLVMTYASKHTTLHVECETPLYTLPDRDRYLRIPDPSHHPIWITEQSGRSGSYEPIRSDIHHLSIIPHNQTAPPAGPLITTIIIKTQKTRLISILTENISPTLQNNYSINILTRQLDIFTTAPRHLNIYLTPIHSLSQKTQTHHPIQGHQPFKKRHDITTQTGTYTTHTNNHIATTMNFAKKAKKQNRINRRPRRTNGNDSPTHNQRKKPKPTTTQPALNPEDIDCINIKDARLADQFLLPDTRYRRTMIKTPFCLPRKLYDLSISFTDHPQTAKPRFKHTLLSLTDQAIDKICQSNADHAQALSWRYYEKDPNARHGLQNPIILKIIIDQITNNPWMLTHAFISSENAQKAAKNKTPVMAPCPICHVGTQSFRNALAARLQAPATNVFIDDGSTMDAWGNLMPSMPWHAHMLEQRYDERLFCFHNHPQRLVNKGTHELLHYLSKLLLPHVDTLLAKISIPLNQKELKQLQSFENEEDSSDSEDDNTDDEIDHDDDDDNKNTGAGVTNNSTNNNPNNSNSGRNDNQNAGSGNTGTGNNSDNKNSGQSDEDEDQSEPQTSLLTQEPPKPKSNTNTNRADHHNEKHAMKILEKSGLSLSEQKKIEKNIYATEEARYIANQSDFSPGIGSHALDFHIE